MKYVWKKVENSGKVREKSGKFTWKKKVGTLVFALTDKQTACFFRPEETSYCKGVSTESEQANGNATSLSSGFQQFHLYIRIQWWQLSEYQGAKAKKWQPNQWSWSRILNQQAAGNSVQLILFLPVHVISIFATFYDRSAGISYICSMLIYISFNILGFLVIVNWARENEYKSNDDQNKLTDTIHPKNGAHQK